MSLFDKKITVLMPVYNSFKTVGASIKSVLNQTYNNFDFIVINDGSTDDTDSIIRSFSDARIKYYVCEHKGRSAASNFGINKAETEYIARIDSDDLFFKDKLEKQVSFLKNNKNIDILFTWSIFFEKNLRLRYWKSPETDEKIKQRLLYLNPINHSSVVFRKEIAEMVMGYNENMDINEDYDLWLRLSPKAKFHCLQDYLVFTSLNIDDKTKLTHNDNLKILLKENLIKTKDKFQIDEYEIIGRIEYYYGDLHNARKNFLKGSIAKNIKYLLLSFIPGFIHKKFRGKKLSFLFSAGLIRKGRYLKILRKMLT